METAKAVRIGRALAEADLVIIGASNGLDMAEGLNLFCADAHFQEAVSYTHLTLPTSGMV